ncbi:uncharacterized protein LOC141640419 [Silene latifolia]|uniref:uncharacterized protein LOC141640419 n=1 Tax=Silene latifolia TaxID=37657 RepID=UPI003D76B8E7
MNKDKSEIYCNGIKGEELQVIVQMSGFRVGNFPFRYLGIPISYKRISIGDCSKLVEKMVDRIRGWGARKLSYAGRLVLVQSVLSQLHSYWARIFVIPKGIIRRIESICRNYLWEGVDQYHKAPAVAWDKVCQDQKQGGLGVINCMAWNTALIGKYTWWLACKEDHLWIRWVHHVYMKQQDWFEYIPNMNTSWTWRQICKVKEKLKPGYEAGIWAPDGNAYRPDAGYRWLVGEHAKVEWYPVIWNRMNWPKHSFIAWLLVLGRLLTKDRLVRFGVINDGGCELCGEEVETVEHLFFECRYSQMCLTLINDWLESDIPVRDCIKWCCRLKHRSLMKTKLIQMVVVALVYQIWNMRNKCRVEQLVWHPRMLFRMVQQQVKARANLKICTVPHRLDNEWCIRFK